jgi:hypothetical protein
VQRNTKKRARAPETGTDTDEEWRATTARRPCRAGMRTLLMRMIGLAAPICCDDAACARWGAIMRCMS